MDIDPAEGMTLEQIKTKGVADKYRSGGGDIYLIGLEFDRSERNISRFERGRG